MLTDIDPTALAQMAANGTVPAVLLVEMLMSEPVRLCSSFYQIVVDGNAYLPLGDLGTVEEIQNGQGEYKPLQFTLSGVNPDMLVIALEENIRNAECSVRLALLHETTHALLAAPLMWTGTLDQMHIGLDPKGNSAAISVTAEHRAVTYARPKPLRYTDADQRRLYPTDTSHRFIDSQANHVDVWPARSFLMQ